MKRFSKITALILVGGCFFVTRGYNLAENTVQEDLTKLNSTEMESEVFRGYCESCKWGKIVAFIFFFHSHCDF